MKKIIVCMLVCFCMLAGAALAGDGARSKDGIQLPRGKWWKMPEVAQQLKLSTAEQAALDDLYFKHRSRKIDLRSTVQKEQLELERLLEKQSFDESAARSQFQKVVAAKDTVSAERFDFLIEVRKLLGHDRFQQLVVQFQKSRMKKDGPKKAPRKAPGSGL